MRAGRRGWQPSPVTALVLTIAVALVGNLATSTVRVSGDWWPPTVWAAVTVLVVAAVLVERARHRGATTPEDAPAALAAAVNRQWRNEIAARGVWQPVPLRVRWSSTGRPVAAARDVVLDEDATDWRELPLDGHVTEIVTAFTGLPHRQLVVLGGPGAGKSVLATLLTLGMLEERQAGAPVPVLLSLASWDPTREDVETLLTRRLTEDYVFLAGPAPGGATMANHLLTHHGLVAVLDGLDELPVEWHGPAIEALDRFAAAGHPLVLTCRAEEYEHAVTTTGVLLSRAAIVELRPLAVADVIAFLRHPAPARARWEPVLDHLREHPDGPLATVLSTPLMVSLARARYVAPSTDPTELLGRSRRELREVLIDGFVPALYRDSRDYPPARAEHWLSRLAYQLDGAGTRELWWWTLRPTLFPTRMRRRSSSLATVAVTAGAAVAAWLVALVFVGPGGALGHALVAAVLVGVNGAGAGRRWWPAGPPASVAPRRHVPARPALGVLYGLLSGILTGEPLACGLAGLLVGCVAVVLPTWTWPVRDAEVTPRLTLRLTRRAFCAAAVQHGLVGGLLTGVAAAVLPGVADPYGAALTAAVVSAVAAALGAGLWLWARYRVIHLLAAFEGELPWRLWRFLADAHRRGALRQVGTAWQFRHVLVQEYLADCARAWHHLHLVAPRGTRRFPGVVLSAVGEFFGSLAERRRAAARRDPVAASSLVALLAEKGGKDELRARSDARDHDAGLALARLLIEEGAVDEALPVLWRHADADAESALVLARKLDEQGRPKDAVPVLRAHLAAGRTEVALPLAQLLIRDGRADDARLILRARADVGDDMAQVVLEDLQRWDE